MRAGVVSLAKWLASKTSAAHAHCRLPDAIRKPPRERSGPLPVPIGNECAARPSTAPGCVNLSPVPECVLLEHLPPLLSPVTVCH